MRWAREEKRGPLCIEMGFTQIFMATQNAEVRFKIFYVFVKCVSVKQIESMQRDKTSRDKPLVGMLTK